ncbi:hypothetical protein C4A76_23895 [Brevibacillus laterosporus]|uniref:matrixin family metalloprotease n=1 Tax=Brevibacillus laterosporus TaxID=1465 RepID=UPI000CE43707|nr:matrixin family metalloprotease [Brevibacillus laterosporus]PPA81217.1 hypothetical protein C4A76_23895 [Brevibacillus laterosporus]
MGKQTKKSIILFSLISSISFVASNTYALTFDGNWDVSTVYYEDINLSSKYGDLLWSGADAWNGIANIDLYPVDRGKSDIEVFHLSKSEEQYYINRNIYGFGYAYNKKGEQNKGTYVSGEVGIIRGTTRDFSKHDTVKLLIHEFGHTLGLAHNNDWWTESIMDYNDIWKSNIYGPTKYDKDDLKDLYPKY